jgi:hypothetical protein
MRKISVSSGHNGEPLLKKLIFILQILDILEILYKTLHSCEFLFTLFVLCTWLTIKIIKFHRHTRSSIVG